MRDNLKENDDEISLFDLILPLIRYRRLIITATLAGIVLAIGGYFIYPNYQYNAAVAGQSIELDQLLSVRSDALSLLPGNVLDYFLEPTTVLSALREAGIADPGDESGMFSDPEKEGTALYYIRQRMIQGLDSDGKSVDPTLWARDARTANSAATANPATNTLNVINSVLLGVICNGKTQVQYSAFLDALCNRANAQMVQAITPYAQIAINNYQTTADITPNYVFASDFLAGNTEIISKSGAVRAYQEELKLATYQNSYRLRGAVIIFAFIFLSIFAVFVMNCIHNIRQDSEAMAKIHEAIGR
jgi:hypothetical protein